MQDLKDVTHEVHYENFRIKHLKRAATTGPSEENIYEEIEKIERRKDQLLSEKDQEIEHMKVMLSHMSSQLARQNSNL